MNLLDISNYKNLSHETTPGISIRFFKLIKKHMKISLKRRRKKKGEGKNFKVYISTRNCEC